MVLQVHKRKLGHSRYKFTCNSESLKDMFLCLFNLVFCYHFNLLLACAGPEGEGDVEPASVKS